ncbi:MFS transporter [Laceyella putida]|uniref:MFS transporter n=1 Tax=Laceyella putida TaxID=110101 RepID=A0ABW2RL89_9BACL
MLLVFSGTLIYAVDRSSLATASPFIARELHLDMSTMGLVLSSFGWTYCLFNLPSGWLVDRFGAKKIYGIAAAIWSIASALTRLARKFNHVVVQPNFGGNRRIGPFPRCYQSGKRSFRRKPTRPGNRAIFSWATLGVRSYA